MFFVDTKKGELWLVELMLSGNYVCCFFVNLGNIRSKNIGTT